MPCTSGSRQHAAIVAESCYRNLTRPLLHSVQLRSGNDVAPQGVRDARRGDGIGPLGAGRRDPALWSRAPDRLAVASRCANRARRRMARSRVRTRRATRAASAGAISPCPVASRMVESTRRQSSAVRNDSRSIPRCAAGSKEAGGGNSCLASGRSRCGLRSSRSDSAFALSGRAARSGTRRRGLGIPGGRPRGLPELPFAKRPRVARARPQKIRIKLLRFLDLRPGKQVITGDRRRIGNDFRHQRRSGANGGRIYGFMIRSYQGQPLRRASPG